MAAEDLPPAAFLPEVGSAGVLKGGVDLVDNTTLGLVVSSKCRPLVVVNVAGTEGLLEGVFKTFLWCPSETVASGEFTIEQAMAPNSGDIVAVTSATWPLC